MEYFTYIAVFVIGYLVACWRISAATGTPFRRVVINGGGPTNPVGPV